MNSSIRNDLLCNEISNLLSKQYVSDDEIKAKLKYIQNTDSLDNDTFSILKTALNKKDFC
jgi:hypothetical protein